MGFTIPNFDSAAYPAMARIFSSDFTIQEVAGEGYCSLFGGSASAGTNVGTVQVASGTDMVGNWEFVWSSAVDNINCLRGSNATTIAAGSNGTHTNTFTGSQSLSVASTTGFPSSGVLFVYHVSTTIDVISYTSTDSTHFLNCTLVSGSDITLATADTVLQSNVDSSNPKWALLEMDSSGNFAVNLGTAAASPSPPTPTASRVVHAAIYIPANATIVDTLTNTPNGNAKIVDKRVVKEVVPRIIRSANLFDSAITNPRTLTSLMTSGTVTIPAHSGRNGDTYRIRGAIVYKNTQNANNVEIVITLGANTMMDVTSTSLAADSNSRYITFECDISAKSSIFVGVRQFVGFSGASASPPATNANIQEGALTTSQVQSSDQVIDIQAVLTGTSSSTSTLTLSDVTIEKIPAIT